MIYGEAFAGFGLQSKGLELAGWVPAWFIENDEFCRKVLRLNHPDVPVFGDARTTPPRSLPPVDVFVASPPCQDASVAGKQRGPEGDNWLWEETIRIARHLKSRWILFENPPGIHKVGLSPLLAALEDIGYQFASLEDGTTVVCEIPAGALQATHERQRVWIVGWLANGYRSQRAQPISQRGSSDQANAGNGGTPTGWLADAQSPERRAASGTRRPERRDVSEQDGAEGGVRATAGLDIVGPVPWVKGREAYVQIPSGIWGAAQMLADGDLPLPCGDSFAPYLRGLGNGCHVPTVYELARVISKADFLTDFP